LTLLQLVALPDQGYDCSVL
jgi:hypothetical protein